MARPSQQAVASKRRGEECTRLAVTSADVALFCLSVCLPQVMPLPRARPGSWEDICHRAASKGQAAG